MPFTAWRKEGTEIALGHTEPSVLSYGGRLWLFYRMDGSIGLAELTPDGSAILGHRGTVLSPMGAGAWATSETIAPCAVDAGATVSLYYEGAGGTGGAGAIGLAFVHPLDSPPRVYNTLQPVLVRSNKPNFDTILIGTPFVMQQGNTWFMYYHGWDGVHDRIGLATSTDGRAWVPHAGNPVLDIGAPGVWDSNKVGRCYVIVLPDGIWYMLYEGSKLEGGQDIWGIGLATSRDGYSWGRYQGNPVLAGGGNIFDAAWVQLPSLISLTGRYFLYYSGNDGAAFHLMRAQETAPAPGPGPVPGPGPDVVGFLRNLPPLAWAGIGLGVLGLMVGGRREERGGYYAAPMPPRRRPPYHEYEEEEEWYGR